jgi:pimeloyl-ACP methyl ester carboxylesterase
MTTLDLSTFVPVLLFGAVQLQTPSLAQRNFLYGVRNAAAHGTDPAGSNSRTRYRDHPAVLVPMPRGAGRRVNFARPVTWLLAAATAAIVVLLAACSTGSAPPPSPAAAAERDLTFRSGADTIYATFQPAGATSPAPAALIISGSGPTDRNGNDPQLPHLDTNLNFAKTLIADGVASLRYDKLGSGKTGLATHTGGAGIDFDLYSREALDAYRTIATQPGVDPHRLIVLGHSEGALFALWLADQLKGTPEAPRAIVLAAPAGSRYLDLISAQLVAAYQKSQAAGTIDKLTAETDTRQVQDAVATIRTTGRAPTGITNKAVAAIFSPANVAFLTQADRLDPADLARGLGPDFPVLVLHGADDAQVSGPEIQRLMTGFQTDRRASAFEVPAADHLFKVVTGSPDPAVDYPNANRAFAPQVAPQLSTFLRDALH